MQDSYAIMLMDEIKKLTQEVKNLNSTLSKVATNTNNDMVLRNIADSLEGIERKLQD